MMKNLKAQIMNERGAAGTKAAVAIVIVAVVVYAAFKVVPVYYDHWSLEDDLSTKIQFAFVNWKTTEVEKQLNTYIRGELKKIGAQYEEKNIRLQVNPGARKINLELWYHRTIDLPFFPNPKQFYIQLENTPV